MFVVIGLGNPGKDYKDTRHNVGFKTIDLLSERNNIKVNKIKFRSVYGEGFIGGKKVILLKPQTYMNNSGLAVQEVYNFYKLPIENIIVVVDDIDVKFGTIKLRKNGSGGSHNGLKSIISQINNRNFPRVKIGIGRNKPGEILTSFVLGKFPKAKRETIEAAIMEAAESIETIITEDINRAMNDFN